MPGSVRWYATAAAAVVIGALGGAALGASPAHAASVLWYPTANVWTDPSAQAECQAMGQQEVASGNWDAYSCRPDPSVSSSAVQLWVGIWVGCPTCTPVKPDAR